MRLSIDVWSDVACPWCWVGKRRLERAVAAVEHEVVVRWRAFELDPCAPRSHDGDADYVGRLARKYGVTAAEAQGMIDRMTAVGAEDGLAFRFDRIRPGNTFDAHRLLHLAGERGVQSALKERLFSGYFSDGEAIGERAALAAMATSAGLDAGEVAHVLDTDAHGEAVRADEAEAQALGIHGVPFFLLGERLAFSGAQPVASIVQALERAAVTLASEVSEGAACGPEGCR